MPSIFICILWVFFSVTAQSQSSEKNPAPQMPRLACKAGNLAKGEADRWSLISKCPAGYAVTGLQKIDLLGDHNNPIAHVNDFTCDDSGCKAWCIGSGCNVEARCCTISN